MTIIQWNICGYLKKYQDLKQIITDLSPGCVCLQETMLGPRTPIPPAGYSLITNTEQQPIPGQGLGILVHRTLPFTQIDIRSEIQTLAVRIHYQKLITICNIYLNPNQNITKQSLENIIQQLPEPFILMGDFNAKHTLWGGNTVDRRGRIVESLVMDNDISILNTGSKTNFHQQTGSFNAVDISLCSPQLTTDLRWRTWDDLMSSDHFPIIIEFTQNNQLPSKSTRYNTNKAKWNEYETLTYHHHEENDNYDADYNYNQLVSHIINAANQTIPKTSTQNRNKPVPWWDETCTQLCIERKRALRRYQRSRSHADKVLYLRARARAQYHIKKRKTESWKNFINSINRDTPMTKIWKKIKKINGKFCPNHPPCLLENNQLITDTKTVCQILANHYSSISSNNNYPAEFNRRRTTLENIPLNFNPVIEEDYNLPITINELINCLKTCTESAPGEDLITYNMIKKTHPTCKDNILRIFNQIWNENTYPKAWEQAITLSFPKPNKNKSLKDNYRPIALTSSLCKLFEKIVNIRLVKTLENRQVISNFQFGFRKHRSTIDALLRIQTDILDAFSRKEHTIAVFFDIKKAYDTAWRHNILETIHKAGIRGNLAYFIKNFLNTRKFKTQIGAIQSDEVEQEQGVPQGSVLSCTLFLLAINGIITNLPADVKAALYVDDLVIYSSSNNINSIERRLQITINRIQQWANNHGFQFSTEKTTALHFHRKRGLQQEPSLNIYGQRIHFHPTAKYLGMIFDQRLRWKEHINSLKTKAIKSLDIIKCLSKTNWGSDRLSLLRLYRSIIRSKLDYGSFIYWTASSHVLKKLDPIHNTALRICLGAFKSSPIASLYAESGEMSLENRRNQLAAQFFARCQQNPNSPIFQLLGNVNIENRAADTLTYASKTRNFLQQINQGELSIIDIKYLNDPIWKIPLLSCSEYNYPKKGVSSDDQMRALFNDHNANYHREARCIYTDGSKSGNLVGCSVIYGEQETGQKIVGHASSYSAELYAILAAVEIIHRDNEEHNFVIYTDSKSVLMSLSTTNASHPIICRILHIILKIHDQNKRIKICWVPAHIGIVGNERADRAANRATNNRNTSKSTTFFKDYFNTFKTEIMRLWQQEWNSITNNKLRKIKQNIKPWQSSYQKCRKYETTLCRIRIGHSLLTHQYLMERTEAPLCDDCIVPLTIKHAIAECPTHSQIRKLNFPQIRNINEHEEIMKIMLAEDENHTFNLRPLICYLYESNFINRI